MNTSKTLALTTLFVVAALSAHLQAQTSGDHAQHRSEGATSAPTQTTPTAPDQALPAMDKQLQLMRDISRKLADAKTAQERQALMAEHHKTMQDSMKLMNEMTRMPAGGMGGPAMHASSTTPQSAAAAGNTPPTSGMGSPMMGQMMQRHAMMEKRMEMMQAMMQMMMDRMPTP